MWHGKCVPHKALYSHFFLGFQRMPNFAFFKGSDDAEISQKQAYVIGKLIRPQKGKSTHSLSISPFFPELFSFSGFMKNRLTHYNYSFLQLFGQGFFPLFSSLSLRTFLSFSCQFPSWLLAPISFFLVS